MASRQRECFQQQRQRGYHAAACRVRGQQAAARQSRRGQAAHEAGRLHLPQLRPGREVSTVYFTAGVYGTRIFFSKVFQGFQTNLSLS